MTVKKFSYELQNLIYFKKESINALALNNKGTTLISGSDDKTIQIFALKEGKLSEDCKLLYLAYLISSKLKRYILQLR